MISDMKRTFENALDVIEMRQQVTCGTSHVVDEFLLAGRQKIRYRSRMDSGVQCEQMEMG